MTASLACAVHCAAVPLLVAVLPMVGLGFLKDERLEWALVASSAIVATASLTSGYRRHARRLPLGVLALGLMLLVSGRFVERGGVALGTALVVCGGLLVALAHFFNHRGTCGCRPR